MCDVRRRGHVSDNVRCKMHQMRFKRKRKIVNAKIYEDKRDLYCISACSSESHWVRPWNGFLSGRPWTFHGFVLIINMFES